MSNFKVGIGGKWLVTQHLCSDNQVVNSCANIEDARSRADDLAGQSPDREVTIYKAVEKARSTTTPVQFEQLT